MDYYEVLGVSRDASQADIKKAYRKAAREHHPDLAGPDADDAQFKNVQAAYDVLGDEDKRAMYDRGVDPRAAGGGAGAQGFGFEDIFETFFGGSARQSRGPASRTARGGDTLVEERITLEEAVFGARKDIRANLAQVCETCHGSCCAPGTSPVSCRQCGGSGHVQRVTRSLLGNVMTTAPCTTCGGYGTVIESPCQECSGHGRIPATRTVSVDIPAGVETGTRIRLTGRGDAGVAGGQAGDLYVEVRVREHEIFERRGDNLHCTLPVPMTAAALGTVVTVPTLDGDHEIEIAPGTQSGSTVRLKGLGAGRLRRPGRGDLHVHIDVVTPTDLDSHQKDLLRQLAEARGEDVVEGRLSSMSHSVFDRIRQAFTGQ